MAVGDSRILQIVLKAVDDASGTLAQVGEEITGLDAKSKTAAASFAKAGDQLSSVGGAMLPVSLAAAGALGLSAKAAMDFQQQMELLHTQAGLSQQSVDGLKSSVLALAPTVGQGPTQLAEAFYHIASAGNGIWSTAQMLDMLKIAAEGAAVGQASLDDTTYSLTSALASGVKGAKDAAEMMSVLNAIVGAGDMHFQDLNGAIGTGFLSTAATFGISLQSLGTALATLTDNGEQADAAATRLRMSIALMAAPTQKASELLGAIGLQGPEIKASTEAMTQALQKAGLSTVKLSDDLRQPNGIMVALQDLKSHLESSGLSAEGADALLSRAFGGGRTDAAMLTMLQNLDRMDTKFKLINGSTSKFASDWASQQDTAAQHVKDFLAQVDVLGVKLGNAFLPTLTKLADQLSRVADWFGQLNPHVQQFVVVGLALAALLAPALLLLGGLATAIGALLSPVGLVALAVLALLAAWALFALRLKQYVDQFTTHGKTIQAAWQAVSDWFAGKFLPALDGAFKWIVDKANWLKDNWLYALGLVVGFVATLPITLPFMMGQAIVGIVNTILRVNWGAIWQGFKNDFAAMLGWLSSSWNNSWNTLTNFVRNINWSAVLSGIGTAIAGAFKGALSGIPGASQVAHNLHVPGFASGTSFAPGGWALVGERGPELVNLPRGSQVIPHNQVGAAGASVNITGPITIQSPLDLDTLGHNILWSLKTSGRL